MIAVELAFVTPHAESLLALQLELNATVADAIAVAASQLQHAHPECNFEAMAVGIWGQKVARDQRLKEGDRVEIYRELERDPMESRRLRASG